MNANYEIKRKSDITGKTNVMTFQFPEEEINANWDKLTTAQKSFINLGITPEEWEEELRKLEEEDDEDPDKRYHR